MEEINTNIKNIVDEVKSFKEDNVKKIEALEQKNADMEKNIMKHCKRSMI